MGRCLLIIPCECAYALVVEVCGYIYVLPYPRESELFIAIFSISSEFIEFGRYFVVYCFDR